MDPSFSYIKIKKEEKDKAGNKVERKKNVQERHDSRNPQTTDTVQQLAQVGRKTLCTVQTCQDID